MSVWLTSTYHNIRYPGTNQHVPDINVISKIKIRFINFAGQYIDTSVNRYTDVAKA